MAQHANSLIVLLFFTFWCAKVYRKTDRRKRWLWEIKKAAICQNRIAAIGNVNSQEDLEIPSRTILDFMPFSGRLRLKE